MSPCQQHCWPFLPSCSPVWANQCYEERSKTVPPAAPRITFLQLTPSPITQDPIRDSNRKQRQEVPLRGTSVVLPAHSLQATRKGSAVCINLPQENSGWNARIPNTHLSALHIPSGLSPLAHSTPPHPSSNHPIFAEGLLLARMVFLRTTPDGGLQTLVPVETKKNGG